MELTADIIFLFLSSVNIDLYIFFIVIGMGFEIKYVGTTELTNIPYISVQLIFATAITSYHQKMF